MVTRVWPGRLTALSSERLTLGNLMIRSRAFTQLTVNSTSAVARTAVPKLPLALTQSVRRSHGARKMVIRPSRYQWNHFWDDIHYYTLLAAVPLGLVSLYAYIFIGPAELTEIPDGYEPQEYEYERHPITRLLAWIKTKLIISDQEAYERDIAYINEERMKARFRREYKLIKEQESLYGDYRGYFFIPVNPRPVNQQQHQRQVEDMMGDFPFGFQSEDPRELPHEIRKDDY